MTIDGGTCRIEPFKKESRRMVPNLTKTEVAKFFRGTNGVVTLEALQKHFDAHRNGKKLRLAATLTRLEDEEVIVRFENGTFQYADYARRTAVEANSKKA